MLIFLVFIIVLILIGNSFSSGVKDAGKMLNDSANYLQKVTAELEKNTILESDSQEEKERKTKNSQAIFRELKTKAIIWGIVILVFLYFFVF